MPSICLEISVKSISFFLGEGTAKLFLNAKGDIGEIKEEQKAFPDYVTGKPSEDEYVQKLEEAACKAKKNRKWGHEYMALLMRDQENIERGDRKSTRLNSSHP